MRSHQMTVAALIAVAAAASHTNAQVQTLGSAPANGQVRKASCSCCGHGHGLTVWGGSCIDSCCDTRPGLFPPCPNPCKTTLLGELILDIKCAVDTGVSRLLGGLARCTCGLANCAVCSMGCDSVGCDAAGCDDWGTDELHLAPADSGQPVPPSHPEADPFKDDPMPAGSTSRNLIPSPRFFKKTASRSTVRRATHVQAASKKVAQRKSLQPKKETGNVKSVSNFASAQRRTAPQHYHHPGTTKLRTVSSRTQTNVSQPELRFRD